MLIISNLFTLLLLFHAAYKIYSLSNKIQHLQQLGKTQRRIIKTLYRSGAELQSQL